MNTADLQGWGMLAISLVLLIRTFVGDGKKGVEIIKNELKSELNANKAEIANVRANLFDFQLKVAQEYTRNDQIGPRLDRIEGLLTDFLSGRRHER